MPVYAGPFSSTAAYPTPEDLASYLQHDLDASTAALVLAMAAGLFETAAATKFGPTSVTYQVEGRGQPVIALPREPVISVDQVRVAGSVLATTEYTVVMSNLFRVIGWGRVWGSTMATAPYVAFPPDLVEVDFTYGYTSVPDDVKAAVLETAAAMYGGPDVSAAAEQIDDYRTEMSRYAGGAQLGPGAKAVAEKYRRGGFA